MSIEVKVVAAGIPSNSSRAAERIAQMQRVHRKGCSLRKKHVECCLVMSAHGALVPWVAESTRSSTRVSGVFGHTVRTSTTTCSGCTSSTTIAASAVMNAIMRRTFQAADHTIMGAPFFGKSPYYTEGLATKSLTFTLLPRCSKQPPAC